MKKIPTFIKIGYCIAWLVPALIVYLMHDMSSTTSSLIWLAIGAGIIVLYYLINWYRTKKGIE